MASRNYLIASLFALCFFAGPAGAYIFYSPADFYTGPILSTTNTLDRVLDSSYTLVLLGFEDDFGNPNSMPFPYTKPVASIMNVVAGGGYSALTNVYTGSALNINGGNIVGETDVFDSSTVTLNSGIINGNVNANNNSIVNVNGGQLLGTITCADSSSAVVSSGEVYQLGAEDSATITMSGGTILANVVAADQSVINVSGGIIKAGVDSEGGNITINGGVDVTGDVSSTMAGNIAIQNTEISGNLIASGGSIDLEGGAAVSFDVSGADGTSFMNGGEISTNVSVHGGGILNMGSGGKVDGALSIAESGSFVDMSGSFDVKENVNVIQGASLLIESAVLEKALNIFDNSTVTMTGGFVGGQSFVPSAGVTVADQASFTMTGGQIGALEIDNTASSHVTGGFTLDVSVNDTAQFSISGGSASSLTISTAATGVVSGGQVLNLVSVNNSASFILAGGTIGSLQTSNSASATITGGVVLNGINGSGNSTVDIESLAGLKSILGTIKLYDNAKVLVEGIPILTSPSNAVIYAPLDDASSPLVSIYLNDNSSLEVDGVNLTASLLDPDNGGMYSEYQLGGSLQDGNVLPSGFLLYVENGTGANFALVTVPEPGSAVIALLLCAGAKKRGI